MASTTLRDYLQYTEDAISTGHIDEALAQCQHILSSFPESLVAQRLLGEVYLAQEQLEEAQQAFDWILTNDPENIVVYCDRALICERMSDYDTALDCYQQAYELSRGNSQIRHEFNKLSTRVGQQGFMLSRAGLARLYMRGDLLPQAIQEWETVLATSPDRLDARTGLLETYWREGLLEQVEVLANAILSDIPGCLKALLLLAHVTSLKDMQQAEELIQRAEMLDPEMVMAQELFSDLIANQPQDPFLQLLKHEAVILPEQLASPSIPDAPLWSAQSTQATTNGSHGPSSPSSNELFSWSSLDTLIVDAQPQGQSEQDIPSFTWSSNSPLTIDPWSTIDQLAGQPTSIESAPTDQSVKPEAEPATNQQTEPSPAQEAAADGQPEWSQKDYMAEPEADAFDIWNSSGTPNQSETAPGTVSDAISESMWETEAREESAIPTPPAWLDMLTKGTRPQSLSPQSTPSLPLSSMESESETSPSEPEAGPVQPASSPSTPLFAESTAPADMPWDDNLQTIAASESNEDGESSFGPEWLKSLGAEVLEETPVDALAEAVSEVLEEETPVDALTEAVSEPVQQQQEDISAPEQQPATLEVLERDLSQGFVPLEPGSLSKIAEEESLSAVPAQLDAEPEQQTPQLYEDQPEQPLQQAEDQPVQAEQPEAQTLAPLVQSEDQQAVPVEQSVAQTDKQQETPIAQSEGQQAVPVEQSSIPLSEPVEEPLWMAAAVPPLSTPASPDSSPVQEQNSQPEATIQKKPTVFNDSSLDELELTMRRPVVKLQPTAQKPADPAGQPTSASSSRSGSANRAEDSNLSNKERLRKGYHHQLAGDYDDAMQEYRIVIRNAPELLGEIVSNMRALLKLAPRYAPGYRVLGDAYMRQGEYLQAMEAYNKALMMAKKGHVQGQTQGKR